MYYAEMEPNPFRTGMIELPGHLLQNLLKQLDYPASMIALPRRKARYLSVKHLKRQG